MSWLDQTIACSVTVHTWGNSKGVKPATLSQFNDELATQAADKRLSVSKKLLKCRELQEILSLDSESDAWCKRHSVPSLLKGKIYAVPTQFVAGFHGHLSEYQWDRGVLVNAFCDVYVEETLQARNDLGVLYASMDYPSLGDVRSKFSVDVRWIELTVPGRLQELSPEVFQQARERLEQTVRDGQAQIEAMLVAEVEEMISGLQGALQGLDDGTLKRFHPSHLSKIVEWSAVFSSIRNVTGFSELESLVSSLADTISGVRPLAVKEFSSLRGELRQELQGAQVALKGLMEARPKRIIELD